MINIEGGLGAELGGRLTSLNVRDRLRRALLFVRRFYIFRIDSDWKSKTGLSLINRSRREILELAFGPPAVNFLWMWLARLPLSPSQSVRVISRECCLSDALGKFLFPIP